MNSDDKEALSVVYRRFVESRRISAKAVEDAVRLFIRNYHWLAELPVAERLAMVNASRDLKFDNAKREWIKSALVPSRDAHGRELSELGLTIRNPFDLTVFTVRPQRFSQRFQLQMKDSGSGQCEWSAHPHRAKITAMWDRWATSRLHLFADSFIPQLGVDFGNVTLLEVVSRGDGSPLVGDWVTNTVTGRGELFRVRGTQGGYNSTRCAWETAEEAAFVGLEICRILWMAQSGFEEEGA